MEQIWKKVKVNPVKSNLMGWMPKQAGEPSQPPNIWQSLGSTDIGIWEASFRKYNFNQKVSNLLVS